MILTSFGSRVAGSYSNEELVPDFLKREIYYIQKLSNKNQKIEIDRQIVSGSYYLEFKPHGMTNSYRNVQNIIVKLEGQSDDHSLLLNCHYDSVAESPGANDDGVNCVVMIEILRVLSQQQDRQKHSVIFLFNGAEETPLQGAHGFITKHKWTNNIRAFINLEAGGSGGKEMLFQSGPRHSWLIDHYKKAVKMPCGQVASEEIFQSNLIPSDTDFRIFRDFGKIPGLDFAHVKDGYRYHTKFDRTDYISQGVLQRTGENILNLVKSISNSQELSESEVQDLIFCNLF